MTLTKNEILDRLNRSKRPEIEPIIVTPMLDIQDQIGICGIDVRLGKQFIVFKQHLTGYFTPIEKKNPKANIGDYQEEIIVPVGGGIVLHPGQLIIGSTFEYVCVPNCLECQVEGRSSWARLGLIVASASTIEAGYKGVITLELSNVGTIPLELSPGIKIAQLIFHKCSEPYKMSPEEEKKKKYQCAIGPGFSKISKDSHFLYFSNKSEM
jgi:dCTP deaminase